MTSTPLGGFICYAALRYLPLKNKTAHLDELSLHHFSQSSIKPRITQECLTFEFWMKSFA